jgi:peptidoglycan hydrolase-like protein with peptidoglycan-binding domain
VLATQCQLARRGFDPGPASGTVKWRTAAAITAFNVSRGLAPRAVVGRRSWTAMLSGGRTRVLEVGDTGRVVEKLQRALSATLQRSVAMTGVFDSATRRAVVEYQRDHGLTVDGTASRETWTALQAGI